MGQGRHSRRADAGGGEALWLETPTEPGEGSELEEAYAEAYDEELQAGLEGQVEEQAAELVEEQTEEQTDRESEGGSEDSEEDTGQKTSWWRQDVKLIHVVMAFIVVFGFVQGGQVVRAIGAMEIPYYVMSAGPAEAAEEYVHVSGLTEDDGELHYLSVAVGQGTVRRAFDALFSAEVTLEPKEEDGLDLGDRERERQAEEMMRQSQANATVAAMGYLGEEVVYTGEGASVIAIIEGSGAEAAGLEAGDVILAVDGIQIAMAEDLVEKVGEHADGETIRLSVARGEGDRPEIEEVEAVMGELALVGEDGKPTGETRVMLGIYVETKNPRLETDEEVEFSISGVGGPSAGMIWALEIIDQKTDGSLSRGRVIAGTGTVSADGEVGPIGGMWQKTFGAIEAGAELLIVPSANLAEARKAADAAGRGDLPIVGVTSLEEAVAALRS